MKNRGLWLTGKCVFASVAMTVVACANEPQKADRAPAAVTDSPHYINCRLLLGFADRLPENSEFGTKFYRKRLLLNDSPKDQTGRRFYGATIASPSHIDPDYYYVWIRDQWITMRDIVRMYEDEINPQSKADLLKRIRDAVTFNKNLQEQDNELGSALKVDEEKDSEKWKTNPFREIFKSLGEVKAMVNGQWYRGHWGRPQSDGPAFRAIALSRFARNLVETKDPENIKYVKHTLYDGLWPSQTKSVIKRDLEYILHNWRDPSFDVWEEVKGMHFFTLIVQRKALIEGADLAQRLQDGGAAREYLKGAREIDLELQKFWNGSGFIKATRSGGDWKTGLDMAVVLGVLYGSTPSASFSAGDERVLATVAAIETDAKKRYVVNHANEDGVEPAAILVGRYPEDSYDGVNRTGGNPWILTTYAMAEHAYRVADEIQGAGRVEITNQSADFFNMALKGRPKVRAGMIIRGGNPVFQNIVSSLITRGDNIMKRVDEFRGPHGELPEEIFKDATQSGIAAHRGAQNLTWNYVAYDRAVEARYRLVQKMK